MANSLTVLKLLGVAVALTFSATVSAVGMGGIKVTSALGQRLKADIQLMSLNKDEKSSLVARLAAPDVYKGAGLEYPQGNKFKFEIESRTGGEYYINVSSAQPVNDPFVSLLVELSWSSGRLLREYTFLLDPPGYAPEQPTQAEVQAVAPVVQLAPMEAETKPVEQAPSVVVTPAESKPVARPAEKQTMAKIAKQIVAVPAEMKLAAGNVTVNRGDTLSKIAAQNKPAEVSLERMLVALYRANADQFDSKNMNRIRTGKILRLPDQNELDAVNQSDATAEIHAQVVDWNAYRQKLASAAVTSSQPQAPQQITTGKITGTVADKAPVVKESAKEVLKLSKGEAPGDKAGTAGKQMSAQDKKNAAQEDAIAKAKALKEDQARAALLEKNIKDMQRLAQLKSEALAKLKTEADAQAQTKGKEVLAVPTVAGASGVGAASAVAAASEAKPAPVVKSKPLDKPKPKVVVAPEPSLLDEPLFLVGGAAALLGLGGLGFVLARRKKAQAAEAVKPDENADLATAHFASPVVPSPDTGDFTAMAGTHTEEQAASDDVDPVSEADLFLSFGRDAQAEEILKEALKNTPNNHQIHLKLLGIYANRNDVNSFSVIARQLQDSGDEEAWQQAAAMGRKLEPGNPIYGSADVAADTDNEITQMVSGSAMPDFVLDDTRAVQETSVPDMDFDLGALDEQKTEQSESDFLGSAEQTMIMTPADMPADMIEPQEATPMDFDISSIDPSLNKLPEMDFDVTSTGIPTTSETAMPEDAGQAEAELPNLDDLVFDITSVSAPEEQPEAEKPAETPAEGDDGMAFTLDFPVEDEVAEKPEPVVQPADAGLSEITLNLGEDTAMEGSAAGSVAAGAKDEHWQEVATKLDLARAYQEMGDVTGAREILDEIMAEGDEGQREAAQAMIDQLLS